MAKIRNVYHEALFARELSRWVDPDEVVDVPDEDLERYTLTENYWAAVADPKKLTKTPVAVEETG